MLGLFILYFLISSVTAGGILIKSCVPANTSEQLSVNGMADFSSTMKVIVGRTYRYSLRFQPKANTPTLKMTALIKVEGKKDDPLPGVPADACPALKSPAKCPVESKSTYYILGTFTFPNSYTPGQLVVVDWKVADKDGKLPVCFKVDAIIVEDEET